MSNRVSFTLDGLLPLLNRQLRTHWAKRRLEQRDLAWRVVAALGASHRPAAPISPARVYIERHCTILPDVDGLYGSAKQLVDVLCMQSRTHPVGLGIIEDDAPQYCRLYVEAVKVRHRNEQQTRVLIESAA